MSEVGNLERRAAGWNDQAEEEPELIGFEKVPVEAGDDANDARTAEELTRVRRFMFELWLEFDGEGGVRDCDLSSASAPAERSGPAQASSANGNSLDLLPLPSPSSTPAMSSFLSSMGIGQNRSASKSPARGPAPTGGAAPPPGSNVGLPRQGGNNGPNGQPSRGQQQTERLYLCLPFVKAALVKGNFKTIVALPKCQLSALCAALGDGDYADTGDALLLQGLM